MINSFSPNNAVSTSVLSEWSFIWYTKWSDIWSGQGRDVWETILASDPSASPFYHPACVRAWLETNGGETKVSPVFLLAKGPKGYSLWFPLVYSTTGLKQGFLKKIVPVGQHMFDYHDPLRAVAHDDELRIPTSFWSALILELESKGVAFSDLLCLPRLREQLLSVPFDGRKVADCAPLIHLDKFTDYSAFMASRRKNFRADIRRQTKRLMELGCLNMKIYAPDEVDEVLAWIPLLQHLRRERYPASHLPANYLESLVLHGMPTTIVHCSVLQLDGQAISWHVGFYFKKTIYWYIPIFDPAFAQYSPGKVHLSMMVEWAIEQEVAVFDLLRGREPYNVQKPVWSYHDTVQLLIRIALEPYHPFPGNFE